MTLDDPTFMCQERLLPGERNTAAKNDAWKGDEEQAMPRRMCSGEWQCLRYERNSEVLLRLGERIEDDPIL